MADGINPLEAFGRALGGLGAGLQGRPNPFIGADLERERLRQQAGQFETTEKRLSEALKIQKDQFERQDALTRAQIFKFALESLPKGQALLADIPDEAKRRQAAKSLARFTSQAFQFGSAKADPTMGELATPEFLEDLYLGGTQSLTLVDDIEFTLPEQRKAVVPLVKAGKIKEARDTLTAISHSQQDQILGGVYERIRALPPVEGGYDPETAFRLAKVGKMERRAIDLLPSRFDAAKLDTFYQQAGLIPPSRTAKVAEIPLKAEEAKQVQLAKEGTPLGQAQVQKAEAEALTAQRGPVVSQPAGTRLMTVSPQGQAREVAAAPAPIPSPGDVRAIRQDFATRSKDFVTVRDSFQRIQATVTTPSAAGDIALIFSYMKLLDPQSVVREGEFATAQTAASVPSRIWNQYNRLLTGERLSPIQRQDFERQATNLFRAQLESHVALENETRRVAQQAGLDPSQAVIDLVGPLRGLLSTKPGTSRTDPRGIR